MIEILVVVAIIALLSSVALISLMSAREKSRNVKRLSDMTQMNTALELYYSTNKGYPSSSLGVPQDMAPNFLTSMPSAPLPVDGVCEGLTHQGSDGCVNKDPACNGVAINTYFYVPSGTPFNFGGNNVYPDYEYFFCLGDKTGNFSPGPRILTPRGVR